MGKVMKKIVIALLILTGVLVWDVTRESEDTIILYFIRRTVQER